MCILGNTVEYNWCPVKYVSGDYKIIIKNAKRPVKHT